jgi:hypothetical protein
MVQFRWQVTHVSNLCERLKVNSTLFNFEYNGSVVRGIYFVDTQSLLIGIEDFNVSWFVQFDEELSVVAKIPNDIFNKIKSYFYNYEKNKYETNAFYGNLRIALSKLTLSQIAKLTNDEIKKYLKATRTKDKTYDDEGDKPFFSHWRRQPEGMHPSKHNLDKTERYFGKRIRNICREMRISSVWTVEESEHCLDFMNLNKVKKDLLG